MEDVVRNLYYYFHVILSQVRRDVAWTAQSLEKAINWAKYCEKVYGEAVTKGRVNDVKRLLQDLTRYTATQGTVITLESVKNASQLLAMEFLQCSRLKEDTLKLLLESELMDKAWMHDLMCETLALNSALQQILRDDDSAKQDYLTRLHLERFSKANTEDLERQLKKLSHSSTALLLSLAAHDSAEFRKTSDVVCNWLVASVSKASPQYDGPLATAVWNQESGLLSKLASKNSVFLRLLLEELERQSHGMQPHFDRIANSTWFPQRCRKESWDWDRAVDVWRAVNGVSNPAAKSAISLFLEEVLGKPGCSFWDSLLASC
ncbi:unnamed protein product [Ixodes hexagonus]